MTTKEWLRRAWRLDQEIAALDRARKLSYERCVSATRLQDEPMNSKAQTDKFAHYAYLSDLINARIDELIDVTASVISVINRVPDARLRTLLVRRYVNFETWDQIAEAMNYTARQVTRLHGIALLRAQDVLKCP